MSTSLVEALRNKKIIPETVNIAIRKSPMIYLLWVGIVVLIVGIATQFTVDVKHANIKRAHKKVRF
jgi:hypothetical protein